MAQLTALGRICVSVAAADAAACIAALAGIECAEIRLDAMQVSQAEIRRIFASPARLVATCRPGSLAPSERTARLVTAIESGAAYVDVELDAPPVLLEPVLAAARSTGCQVIVSFHDFATTPAAAELASIRDRCLDQGGDWAKLATTVRHRRDAARLLGLLDGEGRTIVVGMGPMGRVVRVAALLCGSPLTYASLAAGYETAPGQLTRQQLEHLLQELSDG